MTEAQRVMLSAGRPCGAVTERANGYREGEKVRVITSGSQYYGRTGEVLLVGGYQIFVAIEGDVVAYDEFEIRRTK